MAKYEYGYLPYAPPARFDLGARGYHMTFSSAKTSRYQISLDFGVVLNIRYMNFQVTSSPDTSFLSFHESCQYIPKPPSLQAATALASLHPPLISSSTDI
jgi:hypothetical protein